MNALQLVLENSEDLDIRSFRVNEAMSRCYRIDLVARSTNHDVNFESMIGRPAVFRLINGAASAQVPVRTWSGVCTRAEQTGVEVAGLSTYELTIEPQLWMLQHRRNHRIFQHQSVPEIVATILKEWAVEHELKIDPRAYPPLEIRIQYGETDFAFICRLLEEAGIAFCLNERETGSVILLADSLHSAEPRASLLSFVDKPEEAQSAQIDFVTGVRVRREAKPAKVVLRDFDFRNPRFQLEASAGVAAGMEERMEQYHYAPGRFVTEGHSAGDTPTADDRGVARYNQSSGVALAARLLEAQRSNRRGIGYRTNAFDLAPGVVFGMQHHPRAELAATERLLVTEIDISGEVNKEWTALGKAVFADVPYRPLEVTPRPVVHGVQSAIVVGPEEELLHVDEFARVRVQFHWDRTQKYNEESSCWVRVSQAWAGPGYGLINHPRVGHEVLIGFTEGNPDQPVVVGRVFNGAQQVPYKLPASKMMSTWKSDSHSNIIGFDDTPGEEVFYEQAEKDRISLTKNNETWMTHGNHVLAVIGEDKTYVKENSMRFSQKSHEFLAAKKMESTSVMGWDAKVGFDADMKAGHKIHFGVQPVVPFFMAALDVLQAGLTLYEALPQKIPDVMSVMPSYVQGKIAAPEPAVVQPKVLDPEQVQQGVKDLANLFGLILAQTNQQEFGEAIEKKGVDGALQDVLQKVKPGGPKSLAHLMDMSAVMEHMKNLLASMQSQQLQLDQSQQVQKKKKDKSLLEKIAENPEAIDKLQAIAQVILDLIIPTTSITIEHKKIKLETKKASIEIDDEDIKMEAKGDIEIKAEGKVKIEGECVEISPSPCKCG